MANAMMGRKNLLGSMSTAVDPNNRNPWEPGAAPIKVPLAPSVSSAPAATGLGQAAPQNAMFGDPNASRLSPSYLPPGGYAGPTDRVAPTYLGAGGYTGPTDRLSVNWDYKASPEYQWRLAEAQKDLGRQLSAMHRGNSTFAANAYGRQANQIAGEEVDKQYQRALAAEGINYGRGFQEAGVDDAQRYRNAMANYGRYLDANQINYGRGVSEEATGYLRGRENEMENYNRFLNANQINYGRAFGEGERDWNRNWMLGGRDWDRNFALAQMGYGATQAGVNAGNQAGFALANLLSQNGAATAANAVASGAVDGNLVQSLLNSGLNFLQIEQLFRQGGGGGNPGAPLPTTFGNSGIQSPASTPAAPPMRDYFSDEPFDLGSSGGFQAPGYLQQPMFAPEMAYPAYAGGYPNVMVSR